MEDWQQSDGKGESMKKRMKLIVGAIAAVAAVGIGAGAAVASGGDETPLRGSEYEKATAAALEHVGEGTVTETETGEAGTAFEVEVHLNDGSQVEVQIDSNFDVVGSEADDDGAKDADEGSGE